MVGNYYSRHTNKDKHGEKWHCALNAVINLNVLNWNLLEQKKKQLKWKWRRLESSYPPNCAWDQSRVVLGSCCDDKGISTGTVMTRASAQGHFLPLSSPLFCVVRCIIIVTNKFTSCSVTTVIWSFAPFSAGI